jgi:hypothetical protein
MPLINTGVPVPLINTTLDFKRALRAGPYVWPGGYPLYFICSDAEALCVSCAKQEARLVMQSIRDRADRGDGWNVIGQDVNWEDDSLYCAHCNAQIESAYGEPS